LTEIVT